MTDPAPLGQAWVSGPAQAELSPFDRIVLAGHPDVPFLIGKRDQVIRREVQATGQWEPELVRTLCGSLPQGARIVVAGGHIGLLAFQLWRGRPDIEQIAVFEPDSVNAACLSMNIASWGPSPVSPMPVALSDTTDLLLLARNPVNTGDSRVWHTIPQDLDAGGGDPSLWRRHSVVAVALDDVWGDAPLDLILLDTQGWEPEALRGAERVLRTTRPTVVFEWWPRALMARGVEIAHFLTWLADDLEMDLSVMPVHASGDWSGRIHQGTEPGDLNEVTERLLADAEPTAYVEVVARPRI